MSTSISTAHNPIIAAQTANAASSIAPGTTSTVAAGSAQPTARSYANATKKPISSPPIASSTEPPVAVGGSAQPQHGKGSSISPVNGKNPIQPAVPSVGPPTIVNSSGVNGAPMPGDHSRKTSVTISASGASGYMPNGGPVAPNRAPNLTFGSIPAGGSPAISNSGPLNPQAANLSTPINPRITSPATSPSPIPPPASSGGRPALDFQSGQRLVFGGVSGEGAEPNVCVVRVY
jgi:translation initiation factor 4G